MISRTGRMLGLVLLAGALATGCGGLLDEDDTTRDDGGAITEEGELGAFAIQVGDCIADASGFEIESVQGVPCAEPHSSEAYHTFNLPEGDGSYPSTTEIDAAAQEGCLGAFSGYVGVEYVDSTYGVTWLFPTQESWNSIDDREIVCLIVNTNGSDLTGSAQGSGQ